MKTIKNLLIVAILTVGTIAFAQQAPESGEVNLATNPQNTATTMPQQDSFNPEYKAPCPMMKHHKKFAQAPSPLLKQLNLTPEQKTQVAALKQRYKVKNAAKIAGFRQDMMQERAEQLKEFKALLNKEQLLQLEQLQASRKITGPEKMGRSAEPNRFRPATRMPKKMATTESHALKQTDRLCNVLDLTDKQAIKIYKINLKYLRATAVQRPYMEKSKRELTDKAGVRKNNSVSQRHSKEKEILSVLTPYQKIKFKEMN